LRVAEPTCDDGSGEAEVAASADVEALLTTAPVAVDELVRQSGTAPGGVQMALLELELAGRLERHAGGRVSLKSAS
jgi:DNA processing protein